MKTRLLIVLFISLLIFVVLLNLLAYKKYFYLNRYIISAASSLIDHKLNSYVLNITSRPNIKSRGMISSFKQSSNKNPKINLRFWMKKSVHEYLVLYPDYIKREEKIDSNSKLITLATHGDIRYLENILELVLRWNGPISVAVFAPGSDMILSLRAIGALRTCFGTSSDLVKKWVSFHLVSLQKDVEKLLEPYLHNQEITSLLELTKNADNCDEDAVKSVFIKKSSQTVKKQLELPYPISLLRNIARNNTSTHYILFSDIELLPSLNITNYFFDLLSKNEIELKRKINPYVFVLLIFETWRGQVPRLKNELYKKLQTKQVVPFHLESCIWCQLGRFKFQREWLKNKNDSMFFKSFKKSGMKFDQWEPVFIGTKNEPLDNEEIVYEGLKDRVLQLYKMCLMNYDFIILNKVFLAHATERSVTRKWESRSESKLQRLRIRKAKWKINLDLKVKQNKDGVDSCFML